jgi:ABC-2 type transport system ATP-binding protein/sodium transport system ATP-binding protein
MIDMTAKTLRSPLPGLASMLTAETRPATTERGIIEVRQLTKSFPLPNGNELLAVDSVTFAVRPGEVYGLLGPNGAGKTTTIRMILGLLKATSGEATIAEFTSATHPEEVKRRVGYISASAGLYQWLTVREMLLYFADLYGVEPAAAVAELDRLTDLLDLRDLLSRRCATLSTGQKQRVHLARGLIHRPPVLLLDEPTLGLDVLGSQVIVEYIGLLRDEGKAAIITTHRLEEAERLCDRFGLMHRGRLVREGTLAELQAETGCQNLAEMFLRLIEFTPTISRSAEPSP